MIQQLIATRPFRVRAGSIAPLAVALVFSASPVMAQESWDVSREASPADVSSLDGIVAAFYDVVSFTKLQNSWTLRSNTASTKGKSTA